MMKKRILISGIIVLVYLLFASTCASNSGGQQSAAPQSAAPQFAAPQPATPQVKPAPVTTVTIKDGDFVSEPAGRLIVSNMTNVELAIFAGKVERGNFLGAVGTGAQNRPRSRRFDINRIAGLPNSGSFLFRATTYEQVNRKGLSNITEEDVIYTGLVAFNKNDKDPLEFQIFRNVDDSQSTFIYVSNYTNFVLQLRLDSSDGEFVAALAPQQRLKKLWIRPRDDGLYYTFFPTYVYVDPRTGELNRFSDLENVNGKRFEPEPPSPDLREIAFRGPGENGPQYNVAFIRLQNDADFLISFQTARGNFRVNDRGTRNTSGGRTDIYQIDSGSIIGGKTYSGLTLDTEFGYVDLAPVTVKPGYVYDVVFTRMNGISQYDWKEREKKSLMNDARMVLFGD
jgi:hypothetical protein